MNEIIDKLQKLKEKLNNVEESSEFISNLQREIDEIIGLLNENN